MTVDNIQRKTQLSNAAVFNGQVLKDLNYLGKFIKMESIDVDIINNMLDNIV